MSPRVPGGMVGGGRGIGGWGFGKRGELMRMRKGRWRWEGRDVPCIRIEAGVGCSGFTSVATYVHNDPNQHTLSSLRSYFL